MGGFPGTFNVPAMDTLIDKPFFARIPTSGSAPEFISTYNETLSQHHPPDLISFRGGQLLW